MALGVALLGATVGQAYADKGMWLLNELTKENLAKMKELGFQLTSEPVSYTHLTLPTICSV